MPTNRQLDHSFPAVLDIFGKGLNLPALLNIQWPKCFKLQGGFAPWPHDQGLCPWTPLGTQPPNPHYRLVLRNRHGAPNHWSLPPPMQTCRTVYAVHCRIWRQEFRMRKQEFHAALSVALSLCNRRASWQLFTDFIEHTCSLEGLNCWINCTIIHSYREGKMTKIPWQNRSSFIHNNYLTTRPIAYKHSR